jgi:hypothetical protein
MDARTRLIAERAHAVVTTSLKWLKVSKKILDRLDILDGRRLTLHEIQEIEECGFCRLIGPPPCESCPLFPEYCSHSPTPSNHNLVGRTPLFWRIIEAETLKEQYHLATEMTATIEIVGAEWLASAARTDTTIAPSKAKNRIRFWMLYVDDEGVPKIKHFDNLKVRSEARRLAQSSGADVFLLEATEFCRYDPYLETTGDHFTWKATKPSGS